MTHPTFRAYPFGQPTKAVIITTDNRQKARDLAAFHFRMLRSEVTVKEVK